mmetsp:Transcript_46267/g.144726  ORF Transcript_46267/g.144726 Transcript_46267/m.144726 type:complete len:271 (+) Transcript_46267:2218-3030(+)
MALGAGPGSLSSGASLAWRRPERLSKRPSSKSMRPCTLKIRSTVASSSLKMAISTVDGGASPSTGPPTSRVALGNDLPSCCLVPGCSSELAGFGDAATLFSALLRSWRISYSRRSALDEKLPPLSDASSASSSAVILCSTVSSGTTSSCFSCTTVLSRGSAAASSACTGASTSLASSCTIVMRAATVFRTVSTQAASPPCIPTLTWTGSPSASSAAFSAACLSITGAIWAATTSMCSCIRLRSSRTPESRVGGLLPRPFARPGRSKSGSA